MTPTQQNETSPPSQNGWRFEKRLSLDTLIAIVGVAVVLGGPIFYAGIGMRDRIQALEVIGDQRIKVDAERAAEAKEQQKAFLERMDKFNEQVVQLRIAIASRPITK